jgi:uncharacterized membrane protein
MYLPADAFSPVWLWSAHLLYWLLLGHALWRAPWYHLRDRSAQHVLFGMTVAVVVLWTIHAGIGQAPPIHLLGATVLTLMFGWQFALLAMSIVLLGNLLASGAPLSGYPLYALVLAALPVHFIASLYRVVDRHLPNHFFVYIFINAFFGAALSMALVSIAMALMYLLAAGFAFDILWQHYLQYGLLLMFPEAFISGMCMTIFVAYKPQWVSSFNDERYLKNK